MKAILICNGDAPSRRFIKNLLRDYDIISCADGGANIAFKFKILPHFIIGDLDSIKPKIKSFFERKNVEIFQDSDPNSTDIEKSIKFLISRGVNHIDIVSAVGDRLDHNIGNLSALVNYHDKAKLRIIGEDIEIFFVKGKLSFESERGESISLIPLCSKAYGVKTKGLKYKLNNETLTFSGRGISNIATGRKVSIEVKRGGLFVFRRKKSHRL